MARLRSRTGIWLITPAVVLHTAVLVVPLAASFLLSFRTPGGFGIGQYAKLLGDPRSRDAFWATFELTLLSVAGHLVLGTLAAVLLKTRLCLGRLWRVILLIPWIVSPVICGVIWRWMLDPLYGVVNQWLAGLGAIRQPIAWLEVPGLAMPLTVLPSTPEFAYAP